MTTPYASEAFLHQLLGKALAASASDVHLKVGKPPGARVRGDIVYFRVEKIRPEDTEATARVLLGGHAAAERLDALHDAVASYEAEGLGRFRVSLYRQRGALSIVMRSIPLKVPTFAELGVPAAATALSELDRGLVVVAGGSGDGKSSTLAAMVGHLNQSYAKHVITLEDPIEFVHEDNRASISQREIGADVASHAAGLAAALRHDPDVIMLSDLGGSAALSAALDAAEAGHLVLASVTTSDVAHAVARLLAMTPEPKRLADALQGVLAQRLLPKRDGSGLALASEVLVATPAVRDALRGADPAVTLHDLMERGATPHGMQTFGAHVTQLVAQNVVSRSAWTP